MNHSNMITKDKLSTWPEVVEIVNTHGGVAVVTMETLRDIDGYGRLGGTVRANIHRKLSAIGLGTIREELPDSGSAALLVYRLGTPASHLIEMIKEIQSGNSKDALYMADALRNFNEMPNAHEVKEQVRQAMKCLAGALDNTAAQVA